MNRRQLLTTLLGLPAVARIATLPLSSDDVLVVEVPQSLSNAAAGALQDQLERVLPGRRAIVLTNGATLKLLHLIPKAEVWTP